MKEAYKHTDGIKIEGRRVLVDVERGRTMEGWYVIISNVFKNVLLGVQLVWEGDWEHRQENRKNQQLHEIVR